MTTKTKQGEKKHKIINWIIFAFSVALLMFLIMIALGKFGMMYYENQDVYCSVWENGSTYFGNFNCYCPYEDSALYSNLINIDDCNWDYLKDRVGVANYYNEEAQKQND